MLFNTTGNKERTNPSVHNSRTDPNLLKLRAVDYTEITVFSYSSILNYIL